ncbi:MAG: cytochrome c maturation protein CcmE [Deltaproteobacteria bacterium]
MLKGKLKFIIAILVIALGISYLVYGGVKDTMVYYLTVEELQQRVPSVYNERVRVSGTVVPGTINQDTDGALEFQITEDGNNIDVVYGGVVPDIFKDDVEAVVEGVYTERNVFEADTLLAKCPTKYESTDSLYQQQNYSGDESY